MSVYEVIFSAANSCISHELRYVNAVRRILLYVTVHKFHAKIAHGIEAANCERMSITVDTLGEIERGQTENSCLLFVNMLLLPSPYKLIQFIVAFRIFCHYSPRFQRIIVK